VTRVSGGAFAFAVLPAAAILAVDPSGLAPFGPAKWLAIPTLVFAGAAALAATRPVRVARGVGWAWFGFLIAVAIAALAGLDPVYGWIGTPERHLGALAWLLCAITFVAAHTLERREAIAVGLVATATIGIAGLWAAVELAGWEPISLTGAGDRPVGPLGSSAFLGAAAALLVPVAIGFALDRSQAISVRRGALVAAGLGTVALVASGARAAWVGALAAGVVTLLVRRPSRRAVAAAGGALAIAVGLAFASGVAGRVPDAIAERDGGLRGRLDEWRVAARVVAADPLTGAGPEGYRIAFGRHVDDRYEQAHGRDPLPDRAHNAVLDIAATTGIPGTVMYLALVLLAGRLVMRSLRESEPWIAGAATGVVAYALQSLFLFPLAELDPVAWLLTGIVAASVARPAEAAAAHRVPRPVPALAGALALTALVAGALDVVADRDARATLAAVAAERLPGAGQAPRLRPDAVRYRLVAARSLAATGTPSGIDRALAQVDHALDLSPRDPVARAEEARLLLERARLTSDGEAIRAARRALDRLLADDPRNAETLLRSGVAAALDGDDAAAEGAWLAAERLAPRSAAASVDLALAYARTQRWDEARAAARRALQRDPGNERALEVLRRARANGT
jgi:O-antigen ligase